MFKSLLRRFREPSSWAAVSAVGVLAGLPAGAVDVVVQAAVAVTAAVAFFLPEQPPK